MHRILTEFQRKLLQKSLQEDLLPLHRLRAEIMLLTDEGNTQSEICQLLGCAQGTARHWMLIAQSGQAHTWKDNTIGRPRSIEQQHLDRLRELVSHSPKTFGYSFKRWTGQWLSKHLHKEFGIEVSGDHINRLLRQHGLSHRLKATNVDTVTQPSTEGRITIRDLQPSALLETVPELIHFTS